MGRRRKKLREGLRVLRRAPHIATRSCDDCARFLYDEDTGEVRRRPARFGLPVRRSPGVPTPCYKCPKVPADSPILSREFAVDLSEQNWQALAFYAECRAVGQFPDDPIVRRWAAAIRRVDDAAEKNAVLGKLDTIQALLMAALSLRGTNG